MSQEYILPLAGIALLLASVQYTKVRSLSRTHFENLSPGALRWQLRIWSLLRIPCAVIAIDIRKMHDLNSVLGYTNNNNFVRDLVSVRQHRNWRHPWRWLDIIGQWSGGDEFITAIANPSALPLVLGRIDQRLIELTEQLSPEQRKSLYERTGGLVDGFHAAIVTIPYTRDAYGAAVRAINATGPLKDGVITGDRSTSGAVGTVRQVLS